jgi:hypothetical protein
VFGHRFRVEDSCFIGNVRLAPYQRSYCEAKGGFISTWVYSHFLYFLERVKGLGYLNLLRLLIYKDFYAPPLFPDIEVRRSDNTILVICAINFSSRWESFYSVVFYSSSQQIKYVAV